MKKFFQIVIVKKFYYIHHLKISVQIIIIKIVLNLKKVIMEKFL
jgi:hypothetical protein